MVVRTKSQRIITLRTIVVLTFILSTLYCWSPVVSSSSSSSYSRIRTQTFQQSHSRKTTAAATTVAAAFGSSPLFPSPTSSDDASYSKYYVPSNKPGVNVRLPDFDELFKRITQLSPLAKQVIENRSGGLSAIRDDNDDPELRWKTSQQSKNSIIQQISKIDNFQNIKTPLLRFRVPNLQGPLKNCGERFSNMLTQYKPRSQWDPNVAEIYELYTVQNLNDVDDRMENKYGQTSLCGIGYCKTKRNIVSSREQMTLCGLQNFNTTKASIIWGVELEDDMNYLLPGTKRVPRSRSHIFSTTLVPTGEYTFDAEYVLQLEVGGFPGWLTGPIVSELVKNLFRYAKKDFELSLTSTTGEEAER